MRATVRALVLMSIVAFGCILPLDVAGQINPTLERGLKPFGSYSGGNIDQISLVNGALTLNIPLWSLPQRGSLEQTVFLRYQNPLLLKETECLGRCIYSWTFDEPPVVEPRDKTFMFVQDTVVGWVHHYSIQSSDGSTHKMGDTGSGWESLDATGFKYDSVNQVITDRSGTRYFLPFPTNKVEDRNGNYLSAASPTSPWVDSLERSIPRPPGTATNDYSHCSGPYPISSATLWTVPGPYGGSANFKFCYVTLSAKTSYWVREDNYHYEAEILNGSWLQSVVLPDLTTWTFEYDAVPTGQTSRGHFGDLLKITFPTGGYIQYGGWRDRYPCKGGDTRTRGVGTRTVDANDGTGPHTWVYGGSLIIGVTVTDPLQNQTVHTFAGQGQSGSCSYYEVQTQYFEGPNNVLLKSVNTDYAADPYTDSADGTPLGINVVPIRVTTTWQNGQVAKTEKTYDYGFTFGSGSNGRFGLLLSQSDYDWGNGAAGAKLRQTDNTYLALADSNYRAANILDPITQTTIRDGGGTQVAQTNYGYDESGRLVSSGISTHRDSVTYRGNQTSVSRWRNLPTSTWLTTQNYYFDTGMLKETIDPGNHPTTFDYSSSFAGAYLTQVTNATSQVSTKNYDFNTGLLTSETDPNNQPTTYTYYSDVRLHEIISPDGGQTTYSYMDGPSNFGLTATTKIQDTPLLQRVDSAYLDGLGRLKQTQLTSDPEGTVFTDTAYDALGRIQTVSNPHRSSAAPTDGTTTTYYDALGRVTDIIHPDNNIAHTDYAGNCVTAADEAGRKRKSCSDALGRLTGVWEDPSGLNYETDYQYDTLNNLTRVDQKGNDANPSNWRTRTFSYDSLSRLLTASNPESGTINYTYDNDGNLLTKQDARSITITYGYDALNRLTGKTYSNGDPAVSYFYDQTSYNGLAIANGIGRRTGMTDASATPTTAAWTYDTMGRALTERRTINGTSAITKNIVYTYNLDGSMASLTYPSGRTVTYAPGGAGRALSAIDSANSINYATNALYAPQGALASLKNGVSGGFTGIVTSNSYNKRLQPVILSAASPSQTVFSMSYDFHLGTGDNGNVWQIVNNRDTTRSVSYDYDELNRIKSAATVSTSGPNCWGQLFGHMNGGTYVSGYDPWANLKEISVSQCSAPMLSLSVNGNNRLTNTGFAYDAAGNMTNDANYQYVYNAENQIQAVAGVTYTYDGDGKRVKKDTGKLYWTGTGSDPLDESDLSGTISEEYVFSNGKRIARVDLPSGTVHYYFSDHLGSASVVTNADGTSIQDESDYYPFGGERPVVNNDPNQYKFTGKERDAESGLDYFGARYYGSAMGRFTSPDPLMILRQKLVDPQQWNMYAHARNNPLRVIDPTGMSNLDCAGRKCDADPETPKTEEAQKKDGKKDMGLIVTPTPEVIDIPGMVKSFLSFFGIEFTSATTADTTDAPKEIPLLKELLWIDQVVNGHGWTDHGQEDFGSKQEYKQAIVDTVQNAKGKDVQRPDKFRTLFWNDKEGFAVWRDKRHPDQGTAYFPDNPDAFKKKWGME